MNRLGQIGAVPARPYLVKFGRRSLMRAPCFFFLSVQSRTKRTKTHASGAVDVREEGDGEVAAALPAGADGGNTVAALRARVYQLAVSTDFGSERGLGGVAGTVL